jgi:hypothetical protein
MTSRLRMVCLTIAAAGALVAVSHADAQVPAWDPSFEGPQTVDGHPDLQGNWSNVTLTPFERPDGREPVYSWDEVREIEQPEDECPPNPGTVVCGRRASTGSSNEARLSGNEYNEVYWDRGSRIAIVNGEPRTSLVTWPANGRVPDRTEAARQYAADRSAFRGQFVQYDHPELRPLGERCIVSFGSSAGPPMMPNSAYNNNYTIVQTSDHVMIVSEMVHDFRIIRLGEPDPLPSHVKPYFGDSWGHYEGNTLVIETTNINPDHAFRGIPYSDDARVTERLTRVDDDTILYEFTVDDPVMYTEQWGGEIPFERFDDLLYEYSCHEGNYALSAVLSGARYEESLEDSGR